MFLLKKELLNASSQISKTKLLTFHYLKHTVNGIVWGGFG